MIFKGVSFTAKIFISLACMALAGVSGAVIAYISAVDSSRIVKDAVRVEKIRTASQNAINQIENQKACLLLIDGSERDSLCLASIVNNMAGFVDEITSLNNLSFWMRNDERVKLSLAVENSNLFSEGYVKLITSKKLINVRDREQLNRHLSMCGRYLKELSSLVEGRFEEMAANAEQAVQNIVVKLVVSVSVSLVIGIFFGIVFVYSFAVPLQRLKFFAGEVGKGDFDVEFSFSSADAEMADLIESFTEMAEKLKKYRDNLVKSEQLRTVELIASGVGHEINNPLMIISGNAEYVRSIMVPDDKDIVERMTIIVNECERMATIVKKLSEIKRVVTGDYSGKSGVERKMLDVRNSA